VEPRKEERKKDRKKEEEEEEEEEEVELGWCVLDTFPEQIKYEGVSKFSGLGR
jgi:hypothetical protein